jgi:hypothetical protein
MQEQQAVKAQWPVPGSITDREVRRLIAVAHLADEPRRLQAIHDAVAAAREHCAQEAETFILARGSTVAAAIRKLK